MTKHERAEIIAKTHLLLNRAEEIFNEMISCIEENLEQDAEQLEVAA
jgi:nucleoid DNA-binding protein